MKEVFPGIRALLINGCVGNARDQIICFYPIPSLKRLNICLELIELSNLTSEVMVLFSKARGAVCALVLVTVIFFERQSSQIHLSSKCSVCHGDDKCDI